MFTLEFLDILGVMRNLEDQSIYSHSINVVLMSRANGKWIQITGDDLKVLTLVGLLHDIGKTQLLEELINKPGKYTDEELALMKTHPLIGKKILNDKGFDPRILYVEFQHHERNNGSGYPRGLEEEEIIPFIVGIVYVYDTMTFVRTHLDPLCSFQGNCPVRKG